jgi:hypothetical protein
MMLRIVVSSVEQTEISAASFPKPQSKNRDSACTDADLTEISLDRAKRCDLGSQPLVPKLGCNSCFRASRAIHCTIT